MSKETLSTVSQSTELFPGFNELRARFFALFLMATPDAKCERYLRNRPPCEEVKDDRIKFDSIKFDDSKTITIDENSVDYEHNDNWRFEPHMIINKMDPIMKDSLSLDKSALQRLIDEARADVTEDTEDSYIRK